MLRLSLISIIALCGALSCDCRADEIDLLYPYKMPSTPLLEFRARSAVLNPPSPGHVFVLLGRQYADGTTVFYGAAGFYPKDHTIKVVLGTPGAVKYTVDDLHSDQTFRVNISEKQSGLVKYVIRNWDEKTYALTWQNCVSLQRDIAKAIGLTVPEFNPADLDLEIPTRFLSAMRSSNQIDTPIKTQTLEDKRAGELRERQAQEQRNIQNTLNARKAESQRRMDEHRATTGPSSVQEPPGGQPNDNKQEPRYRIELQR